MDLSLGGIDALRFPTPLPDTLLEIEQSQPSVEITDIAGAVLHQLEASGLLEQVHPRQSVAIGVGSRGIANLTALVQAVAKSFRSIGAQPFAFPAMGSHGGATASGQRDMLSGLGVTEESVGMPIRASMDVVEVGRLPDGPTLFMDAEASAADHTFLINRVKPHTDFDAELESGLAKMAVIGLGKRNGAEQMHALGAVGFRRLLGPAARVYESSTNLLGGVAVVENAQEATSEIAVLAASEIGGARERELLVHARERMGRLPFDDIDLLVLGRIGKNISGTGMDTNVVGRLMIPREREPDGGPNLATIVVLDLSAESHGNAAGVGLANVTTARLVRKIDWSSTYTNAVTSGIFGMFRVSLPIVMPDDRAAIEVGLRGCGRPLERARIVFARDTLDLRRLWVSPTLQDDVGRDPTLHVRREVPLTFAQDGGLTAPWDQPHPA